MNVLALVLVTLLAAGISAYGRRFLVRRELADYLENQRRAGRVASDSTGRANAAAAAIEAFDPAAVLERVELLDGTVRKVALTASDAAARSLEALELAEAIERGAVESLNVSVRGR